MDDASTTEVDDGVSLERRPDGSTWVHVHIADPSALVALNSELDLSARARTSTIYLPELKAPMFPLSISQDVLSLREGVERQGPPALTFSGKARATRRGRRRRWRR